MILQPLVLAISVFAAEPNAAPLTVGPLMLDSSAALAQPETKPSPPPAPATGTEQPPPEKPEHLGYGRAGSHWLTIGAGYAYSSDSNDFNLSAAWSTFLADSFEFGFEGGGWWFDQEGDSTGGLSLTLVFRWHMFHPDDYSWTIFGDLGMGLLGAFDEVPDGGTGFDFMPRAGAGFTIALTDAVAGPRLMGGVRYHHISNGRIEGDVRNPGRDGIMFYAAIVFPF